jgi:hypothetical protein
MRKLIAAGMVLMLSAGVARAAPPPLSNAPKRI